MFDTNIIKARLLERRQSHLLQILVLICLTFILFPNALESASDESVSVDLFVFAIDRNPIQGLYYNGPDGSKTALQFASRRRAGPFPYEGSPEINFYQRVTSEETGESKFQAVTSASIDQSNGEVLIFFLQNNGNSNGVDEPETLRTIAVDDRPSSFPNGHFRVLNASGAHLEGMIGNQRLSLGFEVSEPHPFSSIMKSGQNWVEIAFVVRLPDAYEMVYANQITFSSRNRSIMVLRPPRRSNSIRINTYLIEDNVADERTASAGGS